MIKRSDRNSPPVPADRLNASRSNWKEALLLALCKNLPLSIGRKIRAITYRAILAEMGQSVQIENDVDLIHASGIRFGSQIKIGQNARIQCCGDNSTIHIQNNASLDRSVEITTHGSGKITIGEQTYIGPYTCLSGDFIQIGHSCLIASHSSLYTEHYTAGDRSYSSQDQASRYKGIVIEDDCWLGSGVRVVDGVTIGKGSVIGAGAIVTTDIPPYSIAVGVPAKVVSQRTAKAAKPSTDEPGQEPTSNR
ncbi:acyltransferase [Oculatella sp. LEGE 06141]|nr:acyltransferase [Oculatella sp. LEGE 06141]